MSLTLSSHLFSFPAKPHFHHRNHHRPFLPQTLISPLNPFKTPKNPPIFAAAEPTLETLPNSAIQRIADKLRSLGFVEEKPETQLAGNEVNSKIGEVFYPNSRQIPNYRVGHTLDPSWSTPLNPVPEPGTGTAVVRLNELKKVAKKEWRNEKDKEKVEEKVPSLAELSLPRSELRRLTRIGIEMKQKMKIGKAGITEGFVNGVHERWRSFEVVKIVCEDLSRINMKRTHDLLERKTGGMVVWRSGSKIVLYRGVNYLYPYFSLDEAPVESSSGDSMTFDEMEGKEESDSSEKNEIKPSGEISARVMGQTSLVPGVGSPGRVRLQLPGERELVEEADRLLDGLGPRFTDWWGFEPLPIDADLLPAVVPGFRKPFRLLPYGVKPILTNDEMTILKRLGRPLPCHFALGRNRKHEGLAEAMLKLWEKCEIAKIAIKRGFQNTNSELMAEELKTLTGGVLLSRDKDYIVFYRGKDFLPAVVSSAIQERRKSRTREETQLGNVSTMVAESATFDSEEHVSVSSSVTRKDQKVELSVQERRTRSIEAAIMKTNRKLSVALDEKAKAEKLLTELDQAQINREVEIDKEGITEEEKYMLRKVGLKMKPFLLLGRRGVFDGTIENMHLHWKYRELVKIICGGWDIEEIHGVARTLEAESGGILIAVERVSKGHAIIVYRGKNYQRPSSLRPQSLLNKKEALKRSIEAQRRQSLKLNVLKLSKNIQDLKLKLREDKETLDGQAGEELKSLLVTMDTEQPEPISAVSNSNNDFEEGCILSIQGTISSLSDDTSEVDDMSLILRSDTVLKDQTSTTIDSSIPDEHEDMEEPEPISAVSNNNNDFEKGCIPSIQDMISSLPDNTSEVDDMSLILSSDTVQKDQTSTTIDSSIPGEHEALTPSTPDKTTKNNSNGIAVRARALTNKERLLLRKEALKMKRAPLLAIGRSNVVTGIAKAIKDHFKKYALVIVNVKGRAKGTSVKEIVFQLEQETGGILVSQEPSKIILYRGWGGGAERRSSRSSKDYQDTSPNKPSVSVSPELLAAMRVECGLSSR